MGQRTFRLPLVIVLAGCGLLLAAERADGLRLVIGASSFSAQQGGQTRQGYYDFGGPGAFAEWIVPNLPRPGRYRLVWVYQNGDRGDRECELQINGRPVTRLPFSSNGDWSVWQQTDCEAELRAGQNRLRLTVTRKAGGPNLDRILIEDTRGLDASRPVAPAALPGGALVVAGRFVPLRIADHPEATCCEVGPDGQLYVLSINRRDRRREKSQLTCYELDAAGVPTGARHLIYEWPENNATPLGLAFDPEATPAHLVAYISISMDTQGHSGFSDLWAGRILRMTLPGAGQSGPPKIETVITHLPHGFHSLNGITFGPDDRLYISAGSQSTLGEKESLLSAAILQADVKSIRGTYDVKTSEGGNYDPYAPDAKVKLYGTAIRQPYDSVWHSNGRLYTCSNMNDVNGRTQAGGGVPEVRNVKPREYLAIVEPGKTYGHVNGARGEWVMLSGNPTAGDDGPWEVPQYPVGIKPPPTFDTGLLHRIDDIGGGSADGMIEYHFPGPHRGQLMAAFYSPGVGRIWTFTLGGDGRVVAQEPLKDPSGKDIYINRALDLCEHPRTGHLYVAKYGEQGARGDGQLWFLQRAETVAAPAVASPVGASTVERHPIFGDLRALAGEVRVKGDAGRGQEIFHREQMMCYTCHRVEEGEPKIGPDLAGLATGSTTAHIIESLLYPNHAVREGYEAILVITVDDEEYSGIPVRRDEREVVLRQSNVPEPRVIRMTEVAEIRATHSIMPEGLCDLLTRQELLDLVRYVESVSESATQRTGDGGLQETRP